MSLFSPWKFSEYGLIVQGTKSLGSGSFGEVWKARDSDGNYYAIKQVFIAQTIQRFSSTSADSFLNLLREVHNLSEINNENVVKYYKCWLEGPDIQTIEESSSSSSPMDLLSKLKDGKPKSNPVNFIFIQMEYCQLNLAQFLKDNSSLDKREFQVQNIFQNLSSGLDAIHTQNIVHRDLKPENIFCCTSAVQKGEIQYTWKIGDFGLSIKIDSEEAEEASMKSFGGTDVYKSPEMKQRSYYDATTDVYSLGLIFLEVLHAFESTKARDSFFWNLKDGKVVPSDVKSMISSDEFIKEAALVEEMLEMDTYLRINSKDVKNVLNGDLNLEDIESVIAKQEMYKPATGNDVKLPFWYGVSPPSPNFVGREDELNKLRTISNERRQSTVLISGLGGIGKSELTRTFAFYFFEELKGSCIWINGESEQTVQESFKELFNKMRFPMSKIKKFQSVSFMFRQICRTLRKSSLLIIIDNVDKFNSQVIELLTAIKTSPPPRPLTLITTRNKNVLGTEVPVPIELSVLTPTEAEQFVKDTLHTTEGAAELSLTLEYFPLTLQQAVSYIQQNPTTTGDFSIQNYLSIFNEQKAKLLNHELNNIEHEYANTTLTTWEVTMNTIQAIPQVGPVAYELLHILAYGVKPVGTLLKFLSTAYDEIQLLKSPPAAACSASITEAEMVEGNSKGRAQNPLVNKAAEILVNYSMCNKGTRREWRQIETTISTHRLVQEVIRLRQGVEKEQEFLGQILSNLVFSDSSWFTKKSNEPEWNNFVFTIWKHSLEHEVLVQEFKNILSKIWKFEHRWVTYDQNLLEKSAKVLTKVAGQNNENTLVVEIQLQQCIFDLNLTESLADMVKNSLKLYHRLKDALGLESPLTKHMLLGLDYTTICTSLNEGDSYSEEFSNLAEEILFDYFSTVVKRRPEKRTLVFVALLQYYKRREGKFKEILRICDKLLKISWDPAQGSFKDEILILIWFASDILLEMGLEDKSMYLRNVVKKSMCHKSEISKAFDVRLRDFGTNILFKEFPGFNIRVLMATLSFNIDYDFIRNTIKSLCESKAWIELREFRSLIISSKSCNFIDAFCITHLVEMAVPKDELEMLPTVVTLEECDPSFSDVILKVLEITRRIGNTDDDFYEAGRLINEGASGTDSGFGGSEAGSIDAERSQSRNVLVRDMDTLAFYWASRSSDNTNLGRSNLFKLMREASFNLASEVVAKTIAILKKTNSGTTEAFWIVGEVAKYFWSSNNYRKSFDLVYEALQFLRNSNEEDSRNILLTRALESMALESCFRVGLPDFKQPSYPETPLKFKIELFFALINNYSLHLPLLESIFDCDDVNLEELGTRLMTFYFDKKPSFQFDISLAIKKVVIMLVKHKKLVPAWELCKQALGVSKTIKCEDVFQHILTTGVGPHPELVQTPIATATFYFIFNLKMVELERCKAHGILRKILNCHKASDDYSQVSSLADDLSDLGIFAYTTELEYLSLWNSKEIANCMLEFGREVDAWWRVNGFFMLATRNALSALVFKNKGDSNRQVDEAELVISNAIKHFDSILENS